LPSHHEHRKPLQQQRSPLTQLARRSGRRTAAAMVWLLECDFANTEGERRRA
jgi:hypothetical protein